MNIVFLVFTTIFTMESIIVALSIPYVERKSWIRHANNSGRFKRECFGPDCLSAEVVVDSSMTNNSSNNKSGNRTRNCAVERSEKLAAALAHRRRAGGGSSSSPSSSSSRTRAVSREFIPSCRSDGSYASIQCHVPTRSCWCVTTETGRPIPGTSVLGYPPDVKKLNCAKYNPRAKSATKRRSSQGRKNRKLCNHADRSRFNMALIKTFRGEHSRYKSFSSSYSSHGYTATAASSGSSSDPGNVDEEVLMWKFDHLDKNKDSLLERNETTILKRLVKQQIQPRQCAKTFISFCANGDKKISKREWLDCLKIGSMENLPFDTFNSLVDSGSSRGMHPFQLLKQGSLSPGDLSPLRSANGKKDSEAREVSNCFTDRQSALASRKSGSNESVIIPECNPVSGLYQRTQCAQGKAYCWCVFEETGQQIPLTVVINAMPDCDKKIAAYKSLKGCAGPKKAKFLADLMDMMGKQMQYAISQGRRLHDSMDHYSKQEQIVRWHYNRLDTNANGILERREWKVFKNETSTDKNLRRCGKKLPRMCDVNQDKKITLAEWLVCLGIKSSEPSSSHSSGRKQVHRSSGQRTGKNPFTTILKQR